MAITKFAQHGLVRLGYETAGEGAQTILILHGLMQDRVALRPLVDALQNRAKVITMDMRGHGGSSVLHGLHTQIEDLAADALAVLDAAEVENDVIVIGIEIGAVLANAMKAAAPDRITNTVLINYPNGEMLDAGVLTAIANLAYKGQAEQSLTRWLDLSWGEGWQATVPKPRIAAARRSIGAMHPILTAWTKTEMVPQVSLSLPGGTPFANEEDVAQVIRVVEPMLSRA